MARLARLVVPGLPHHETQRGNRRQPTFFEDGDYAQYRDLLAEAAERTRDWPWSSVRAHLSGAEDGLLTVTPVLTRYGDFAAFLDNGADAAEAEGFRRLRQSETIGRPLGSVPWIEVLETRTGRTLKPQKRGPKRRASADK